MTDKQQWGQMYVLLGLMIAITATAALFAFDVTIKRAILAIILYIIGFCCVMGGTEMSRSNDVR